MHCISRVKTDFVDFVDFLEIQKCPLEVAALTFESAYVPIVVHLPIWPSGLVGRAVAHRCLFSYRGESVNVWHFVLFVLLLFVLLLFVLRTVPNEARDGSHGTWR